MDLLQHWTFTAFIGAGKELVMTKIAINLKILDVGCLISFFIQISLLLSLLFSSLLAGAQTGNQPGAQPVAEKQAEGSLVGDVSPKYQYPESRAHDWGEDFTHLGFVYSVNLGLYVLTQPETVKEEGSFTNYRKNFGRTVLFDNDEPFWNWMVHPYSGSQLYLYYRANAYSPAEAFRMSFLSSLLFEYTIEVYTEPASLEDIINTPLLGTVLGYFFEKVSMKLLNSPTRWKRWIGHVINPFSILPYFKKKIYIVPQVKKDGGGLSVAWDF